MPSRQTLLRIMLACLGLTALVGVLGVFAGSWDLLGRLMGSTVAGAITAAIMLAAAVWLDTPAQRRVATAVMTLALAQFGMAFLAIWTPRVAWMLPAPSDEALWMTLLSMVLTGWPAVTLIAGLKRPKAARAAGTGLAIDAAVLLLLLLGFWWPGRWWHGPGDRLLLMAVALGVHGLVACLCLVGWTTGDRRWWRWIGVLAAAAPVGGFWWGIWTRAGDDPAPLLVVGSVGALIAHANLVLMAPLKAGQQWLRIGTMVTAAFAVLFLDALLLDKTIVDNTPIGRAAVAAGIVAICGTLAIIVLTMLNRRSAPPIDTKELVLPGTVALTCPVCRTHLAAPVGASACHVCGLRIVVQIDVPRCPACSYALLHHRGAHCPECGAATPLPANEAAARSGDRG